MNRWYIIIVFACALHLVQALALYLDPSALGVTSIYTIGRALGASATSGVLTTVALLAGWALWFSSAKPKVLLLLPQQLWLFITAAGALNYMYVAQFADGVVRSHAFIIADQSSTVVLALAHMWAIIEIWHGDGHARKR